MASLPQSSSPLESDVPWSPLTMGLAALVESHEWGKAKGGSAAFLEEAVRLCLFKDYLLPECAAIVTTPTCASRPQLTRDVV